MNFKKMLPIAAICLVVLMGSCKKDQDNSLSSGMLNKHQLKSGVLDMVNLGFAGNFAILSKTGVTDVYKSTITGDVGTSPITGAAVLVSCDEVAGTIYTVDAAGPLPCRVTNASMLTTAVSNMEAAYTDAAGRINPDFLDLGAGNIGGLTLTPGLYKWTTALIIPTDFKISGGPNDVFIFQVAGTLTMSSAVKVTLEGGVQANNIFWQTTGAVTLGTTTHFEGNILSQTSISLLTGASINGRMLAQTAVTLQMNTVNLPQTLISVSNQSLTSTVSAPFVDLGSVSRFGIIAATAVSNNAGFSEVNDMDIGICPGIRNSVTGFPQTSIVNGDIYAFDDIIPLTVSPMLSQAKLDLTNAYLYAEAATFPVPAIVAGDQGGKVLAPGIYKSISTLMIQSGDLTLDAQGDENAVWIFQVASALTTVGGAGGNVILTGGAQAKNVFWQIGSSATIGDYTSFKGNVLAYTSITMNSHSILTGRLLAINAAVVLTSTNTITKP